jgi:hypothetical protein
LGILPDGDIYPKEERAVRDLLRKRSQLVRQRTANLLSHSGRVKTLAFQAKALARAPHSGKLAA